MTASGGRRRRGGSGQGGDAPTPQLGLFGAADDSVDDTAMPSATVEAPSSMTRDDAPSLSASNDVGLQLPLSGVRLIEASAGTGKTFTLTTLVLRLLLERGASMADILAVTFTRAATQELRQRIRRRLRVARRLLDVWDDIVVDALQGEAVPTCAVLRAAIVREGGGDAGIARVRDRIEAALLQLDEATIATIHGFCHRALREFGFRAGQLAAQTVVDDAGEVWSEVAAELWRAAANAPQPDDFAFMTALWDTPDAMASALKSLCDRTREMYPRAGESPAAASLHALRARALARYETRMDERGQCDQDAVIERVWRATEDDAFASRVAARWPFLLIDEFQDTDPRQWDIFRRLFEAAEPVRRWLCLIGDPKQAIYRFRGGDLETYLRAKAYARAQTDKAARGASASDTLGGMVDGTTADAVAELGDNHRSTPAVLCAIETLFTAHALPFIEERVAFHPVRAAGAAHDDDLSVDGMPVPGLTMHWLPPAPQDPKAHHSSSLFKGVRGKDDEFALMADAAVHAVAGLLAHGRLRVGERVRALRPADIAILTTTNDQATLMRETLARAGIGAALLSGASVFAGEAADDLHTVLAGLIEPDAPGRFRAALATTLLGCDAGVIAMLAQDEEQRTSGGAAPRSAAGVGVDDGRMLADTLRTRFAQAAEHWRLRGPLPALLPFITDAAPRWLREAGGQRRLTDALHLAELLQAESAVRAAPAEQLQWFAQQRAQAARAGRAGVGEDRQLRMEADADAVQISTVHRSKGLEYAVVVLPFVAHRKRDRSQGLDHDDFLDANQRPARAWRCKGLLEPADADAIDIEVEREEQAEAQRQLYVALTRAKHALHVVWSRNDTTGTTALYRLLHGGAAAQLKDLPDAATMRAQVERIAAASAGAIVLRAFDPTTPLPRADAPVDASTRTPPARTARRHLSAGARLHSFSSLHARGGEPVPERGAIDEGRVGPDGAALDDAVIVSGDEGGLGGTAFGNAVHDVLEAADAGAWRRPPPIGGPAHGDRAEEGRWPDTERDLLERALRRQGLAATPAHLAQTARLVSRALNVPLPGDVRLCDWPSTRLVRELPFHFRLRPLRLETLYAVLASHGYPRAGRPAGGALEGLMHGYIDLVYRDAHGRHHVLDYKTNRLPAYDPDSLRRAVRVQDYDLQYLIYLVALRRWLRLRHGVDYDDARHLGGAVYLFLRGIDLSAADPQALSSGQAEVSRAGVHVDPVDPAVIAALDACFDGGVDP